MFLTFFNFSVYAFILLCTSPLLNCIDPPPPAEDLNPPPPAEDLNPPPPAEVVPNSNLPLEKDLDYRQLYLVERKLSDDNLARAVKAEGQLELYTAVVAADLSRCALEKFVKDVLVALGYVNNQPSAKEIKDGFAKFLASTDSKATEFKALIPKDWKSNEIIELSASSFVKLSGVIHRALDSFLDNTDVHKIYEIIEKTPRLTDNEKIIVDCIVKFLYSQKLK